MSEALPGGRREGMDTGERPEALKPRDVELEELRRQHRDLSVLYEGLRNRRSVRLALRLANLTRPIFSLRERLRKPKRKDAILQPGLEALGEAPTAGPDTEPYGATDAAEPMLTPSSVELLRLMPPVTIVIPVYNAFEELKKCIGALIRNTTTDAQILLINDASTDPRVSPFLEELKGSEGITVLSNHENLGFVQTVNRGFAEAAGDVVILNSDTEVTPRWLENLKAAAYSNPLVGTVTPLSDNAGAFSAPQPGVANAVPGGLPRDDLGRLVTRNSARRYPSGPTGNGFCMYLKRAFLETVGGFDAEHFPRGYGEENDLCMRGLKAGWQNVIDDATYVFHHRAASFGAEKQVLLETAQRQLEGLHPEYRTLVSEFLGSSELAQAQSHVRRAFEKAEELAGSRVRTRILYVLHSGVGGTPETNMDLMRGLSDAYECYVLVSDTRTLRLFALQGREYQELETSVLTRAIGPTDFHDKRYWEFVMHVLLAYGIELVHVRHLFKHTLDVTKAAQGLDIPVVMSFHDYYYVCPTIHLLDDQDRFCGGSCTPGQGICRIPELLHGGPHLKHSWVYVWRERVKEMFEEVDIIVTTSQAAKDLYMRVFPELSKGSFEIIEHGRDLARGSGHAKPPRPDEPIRIVIPGSMTVHKGIGFIRQLKDLDRTGRLEFHFMGHPVVDASDVGVQHGPYEREDLAERVLDVAPHFIGLFSIWAETYSHTLTEAWALGIPVIASDLGALGERIRANGGGWLIDVDDVVEAYETILTAAGDTAGYERAVGEAEATSIRSVGEMRDDYDALYRNALQRRQVFRYSSSFVSM